MDRLIIKSYIERNSKTNHILNGYYSGRLTIIKYMIVKRVTHCDLKAVACIYPIIHLLPGISEIIFVVITQQIYERMAMQGMAR